MYFYLQPKRRISKELLENQIITKTLSNNQAPSKQPLHMHSLTARSISKEFRDELKQSTQIITKTHPGGSKIIPNGTEELIKEGNSPNDVQNDIPKAGFLKNKLAFFEKLNIQ